MPSPLVLVLLARLNLTPDLTRFEVVCVDVRVGGVGAECLKKGGEITRHYVLPRDRYDARRGYGPGHGSAWVGAGWRSGGTVTQVRAEESINHPRHVHFSEMEM